ncbi:hypothetical protein [Rufibacter tibetensis]|uniref:Uncharacterized protein n=1 Tax=Rufibacter tibetensis TaxID=512763 RepID=A0A0P0CSX8_9BACT|nr:hypothetical protein [Rufibacter tibetensis]ALJ00599.1 hypothetical protein DC20_18495 [Rufibacter tibetensis]
MIFKGIFKMLNEIGKIYFILSCNLVINFSMIPSLNKSALTLFVFFSSVLAFSCRPSCPISSCQTRMVHRHGEGEYRGMPWYKKQNPRVGEKLPKPSKEMKAEMEGKSSRKKGKN